MRPDNPKSQAPARPRFLPAPAAICWRSSAATAVYDYRHDAPPLRLGRYGCPPGAAGARRRCWLIALGPEWTDEGLPGMTGIVRTLRSCGRAARRSSLGSDPDQWS